MCFCLPLGFGQTVDTIVSIPEISITSDVILASDYDTISLSERNHQQQSLATFLRNNYNIYFKNYGPGSSSTISMNGGKAGEVAIVWNGIQLRNPMLGVNDYSLINVSDVSSIKVIDMASNNIYGAGAISGTLALNTEPKINTDKPHSLSMGYTSYGQWMTNLNLGFKSKSWEQQWRLSGTQSKNNFKYNNLQDQRVKLVHANHHNLNLHYDAQYQSNPNTTWKMAVWARDQQRQIPPNLSIATSKAEQSDQFIRTSLQYAMISNRHRTQIKTFFGKQKQSYKDPAILLDAVHRFDNSQIRIDNQWALNTNSLLKYGSILQHYAARSDNYSQLHQQLAASLYTQYNHTLNRVPITFSGLLKPEWASDFNMDLISELKINYATSVLGDWTVYGGRNIVFPTFNDRYWTPGGNSELVPETNITYGIRHLKIVSDHLSYKIDWFNRHAKNWIQWLPSGNYWTPKNYNSARNYGINLSSTWQQNALTLVFRYQWVRTFLINHPQEYNQTIYTPEHLFNIHGRYNIHPNLSILLDTEYTSKRYTLTDHTDALPEYILLHPSVSWVSMNKQWQVDATVYNILNQSYQGIKNRPMPGITFEINTKYNFNL